MKISDFNFEYPDELIATRPLEERDASRMLVLDRLTGKFEHSFVRNISSFLKNGDLLIINETRVIPARLIGKKESGGKVEILLISPVGEDFVEAGGTSWSKKWKCISNQTARLHNGTKISFEASLDAKILSREGETLIVEFEHPEKIPEAGLPPLPPYIRAARKKSEEFEDDVKRYQTVYAKHLGSSAAPTAGLHFSDELFEKLAARGIEKAPVTLHVGLDTFLPVRVDDVKEHKMHGERFFVPKTTIEKIAATKKRGGRVIAIGTTAVRALESAYNDEICKGCTDEVKSGVTNLFIYPGYKFKIVDAMITNFHQPKSTLLMLVSAFAGRDFIFEAYREAISKKYRLFSYGDCMFIF